MRIRARLRLCTAVAALGCTAEVPKIERCALAPTIVWFGPRNDRSARVFEQRWRPHAETFEVGLSDNSCVPQPFHTFWFVRQTELVLWTPLTACNDLIQCVVKLCDLPVASERSKVLFLVSATATPQLDEAGSALPAAQVVWNVIKHGECK